MNMFKKYPRLTLYCVFAFALLGTFGSLFFSEVLGYLPCVLCWYQRIFLYPVVVIGMVAIIEKDPEWWRYTLPLSILGGVVALYQNLLYYGVLKESVTICRDGVSCTTQYINWLGFIDIPLLSLFAFLAMTTLSICAWRSGERHA